MANVLEIIHAAYTATKDECVKSYVAGNTGAAIRNLADLSLRFLAKDCKAVKLVSLVPGKEYISFVHKKNTQIVARPANKRYFLQDPVELKHLWNAWEANKISPSDFARFSYTVALAPCLAMELFDRQNKKGPATYFECLIGHMFAKELCLSPKKQATITVHGRPVRLTMDFLFGENDGNRIHLAVKMSTRERVVQAWAHQRILDGAHGANTYRGVMVLFSETKLDSRSREVVEICVPDQWLAYQALLSKFERIYYFDVPCRYQELTDKYAQAITIKQFGEFFTERATLFGKSPRQ